MAAERQEEFAPGLDPELQELADAFTEFKENLINPKKKSIINKALGRIRQNVTDDNDDTGKWGLAGLLGL
jgi:hypothetical protein